MKHVLLALLIITGNSLTTFAQCDKKITLQADTVYQLQPDSTRGDDIPGKAIIRLTKDSIHVRMQMNDGSNFEFKGNSISSVCKMNNEYSEGRIDVVYDATLYARGNEKKDKLFFTITSVGGAMKLVGAPESNMSDKLCFVIKSKEEIK